MNIPFWQRPVFVLLCGALIVFISLGGSKQLRTVPMRPISMDMGWGREALSLALAIQALLIGAAAPFAGMLADRWGAPRVIMIGGALFAASVFLMAQSTTPAGMIAAGGSDRRDRLWRLRFSADPGGRRSGGTGSQTELVARHCLGRWHRRPARHHTAEPVPDFNLRLGVRLDRLGPGRRARDPARLFDIRERYPRPRARTPDMRPRSRRSRRLRAIAVSGC